MRDVRHIRTEREAEQHAEAVRRFDRRATITAAAAGAAAVTTMVAGAIAFGGETGLGDEASLAQRFGLEPRGRQAVAVSADVEVVAPDREPEGVETASVSVDGDVSFDADADAVDGSWPQQGPGADAPDAVSVESGLEAEADGGFEEAAEAGAAQIASDVAVGDAVTGDAEKGDAVTGDASTADASTREASTGDAVTGDASNPGPADIGEADGGLADGGAADGGAADAGAMALVTESIAPPPIFLFDEPDSASATYATWSPAAERPEPPEQLAPEILAEAMAAAPATVVIGAETPRAAPLVFVEPDSASEGYAAWAPPSRALEPILAKVEAPAQAAAEPADEGPSAPPEPTVAAEPIEDAPAPPSAVGGEETTAAEPPLAGVDPKVLIAAAVSSALQSEARPACLDPLGDRLARATVYFEAGEEETAPFVEAQIEALAETLSACPSASIEIVGHADQRGDDADNFALSWARADFVASRLRAAGVEAERLRVIAMGSKEPLVDVPERARSDLHTVNRRVEFRLAR